MFLIIKYYAYAKGGMRCLQTFFLLYHGKIFILNKKIGNYQFVNNINIVLLLTKC